MVVGTVLNFSKFHHGIPLDFFEFAVSIFYTTKNIEKQK